MTSAHGLIVYRVWDQETGLAEVEVAFSSLEELIALCARVHEGRLIHRVIISGTDDDGETRSMTLTFQTITASHTTDR